MHSMQQTHGNRAAQRFVQRMNHAPITNPKSGMSASLLSIQREDEEEPEWSEAAPPIPYASWDDYHDEQQHHPPTSMSSSVPAPLLASHGTGTSDAPTSMAEVAPSTSSTIPPPAPASHGSGAPTSVAPPTSTPEASRHRAEARQRREDAQEYQDEHYRSLSDDMDDIGLAGSVSDAVGLTSGILEATDAGGLYNSSARIARLRGIPPPTPSTGLLSALGPLGDVGNVISIGTGLTTAFDSRASTYDRVTGGLSAASGAIGLAGRAVPTLAAGGPATVAGGVASGLGAEVLGAAGAFGTGGAILGSGGAVLGAGLAGLEIGDMLSHGAEYFDEDILGHPDRDVFRMGDIEASHLNDVWDFFTDGPVARSTPPPQPHATTR